MTFEKMSSEAKPQFMRGTAEEEVSRTILLVGEHIRRQRQDRGLTLQQLADLADMSPSMLSLIERGRAAPSLASLAAIAQCLDTSLPNLIAGKEPKKDSILIKFEEQPLFETPDKVLRRILTDDRDRAVKITYNEYRPDIGNNPKGITHAGYEYGLCLEGTLTVEVEGVAYEMSSGDLITLESHRRHKIWNYGAVTARTIWINLNRAQD